jgi:hypothetical protein
MMTALERPNRKEVENRSRPLPASMLGKRIAIHAAKSWDDSGAHHIHRQGIRFPTRAQLASGALVALVTIERQVTDAATLPVLQQRWFFGPYGYVFANMTPLTKSIPVKGMLGFWRVPEAAAEEALGQLVAEARLYVEEEKRREPLADERPRIYSPSYIEALLAAVRRTGRDAKSLDLIARASTPPSGHPEAWLPVIAGAAARTAPCHHPRREARSCRTGSGRPPCRSRATNPTERGGTTSSASPRTPRSSSRPGSWR